MIQTRKWLIASLLIPIVCLVLLTGYKKYKVTFGKEVTLKISGFDPRDLLSGHYIIYTVNYDVPNLCQGPTDQQMFEGKVCLDNKSFIYGDYHECRTFIQGRCSYGRFTAGIERFYIPETKAVELDKIVRGGQGSIIVSITPDGIAQVKDLLINGKSWRD